MSVLALPTPFVRFSAAQIDDESTFTSPTSVTIGDTTWQVVTEVLAVSQLDPVATAIERLIQQDYSLGSEITEVDVDAADGQGAVKVTMIQVADLPSTMNIGTWTGVSYGLARSFAKLVRMQGYGTEFVP